MDKNIEQSLLTELGVIFARAAVDRLLAEDPPQPVTWRFAFERRRIAGRGRKVRFIVFRRSLRVREPKDIDELMLADLKRSDLDEDDAEKMMVRVLSPSQTAKRAGQRYRFASYLMPYFGPDGQRIPNYYRLRSLSRRYGFGKKEDQRYWQPRGTCPRLYLPPYLDWPKVLKDANIPLTISEGEKKAAAACKRGIPCVALGGAYSFRSKKKGIELLPEFDSMTLEGRTVELAYDGDQVSNSGVKKQLHDLARLLAERGAQVYIVLLPPDSKLDDFLVAKGRDDYLALPRVPFDAKAVIRSIRRSTQNDAHERKQRIADICQKSILSSGTAHRVGSEPVIFNTIERRLYSYIAKDDSMLRAYFSNQFGVNASEDDYRFVFEQVRAHILSNGTEAETPLFTHFDKDNGVLQLSAGDKEVFRISDSGVKGVLNGHDGVLFRNADIAPIKRVSQGGAEAFGFVLSLPNFKGGAHLSVAQQDLIYELHFWSLLFSTLLKSQPLLLLHGPKGSAKTSGGRAIGLALYGPRFDVNVVDRNRLDDIDIALIHKPLVVLDNLDGRIKGLENRLATAATGGKLVRRVYYTTADIIEYPLRARVIATSRQPDVFVRDDVRDRTLFLSVERRVKFQQEDAIQAAVLRDRGSFWNFVLSRLPKMIAAIAEHRPKPRPERLADFAQFCLAVGPVVGYKQSVVASALEGMEKERSAFAGEHSGLLSAMQKWANIEWRKQRTKDVKDRTPQRITTGDLFVKLKALCHDTFPFHQASTFGSAIRDEQPMLSEYFSIKRDKGHSNQTVLTIYPLYEFVPVSDDDDE